MAARRHPVRLVVTDDLQRNRLTVFFRLLLLIPHFIWFTLFTLGAFVIGLVNWFATLALGRSPQGMHSFLAGYVRYGVHLYAYLCIAADPYPPFYLGDHQNPYAVDVEIDPPARQNRWLVGFRLFLALPAMMLSAALTGGGPSTASRTGVSLSAAGVAGVLSWFSSLARGHAPRGLRDLIAWSIGYTAQTWAYLFLLTDRYPGTDPLEHLAGLEPPVAEGRARLVNTDTLARARLVVFFRLLFAFPHIAWLLLWGVVAHLAWIANWLVTLVRGYPAAPLARFLAAYVRYNAHVNAFLFVVGEKFPGFVGAEGSYSVDVRVPPAERQNRWITGFRILLVFPALIVSAALTSVLVTVGIFGWFASLALGRMPGGLQSAGAYTIGYAAQMQAYLFVLTDRYPHASPLAVLERS